MNIVGRLTENWLIKLLSLAFALVLWFFVMGERKVEVGFTMPLELKNVPQGMVVVNEVPNQVEVRLSGPRTLLMNLSSRDVSISVDLADLKPGLTSFKRLEERLDIPAGLKVTRLSPAFIDVKLERILERPVPVRVALRGQPELGYRVAAVRAIPSEVLVEGAEGELQSISDVATEPVDVEGASAPFAVTVPVNYRGRFTAMKREQSVEVRVNVEPVAVPLKPSRRSR